MNDHLNCVTDSAGKVRSESAAKNLGDDVFGTISDATTLKSQAFDCSYGQLNISWRDLFPTGRKPPQFLGGARAWHRVLTM